MGKSRTSSGRRTPVEGGRVVEPANTTLEHKTIDRIEKRQKILTFETEEDLRAVDIETPMTNNTNSFC